MSTLIFQVHIKHWEKSQRSPAEVAARAAMPDRSVLTAKPEFLILSRPTIIDRCKGALDKPGRELKTAMLADGSVKLERFIVSESEGRVMLAYGAEKQAPHVIGCLNDGWIQAKYQWRYAVEEGGQVYWLYEDVTLNAVCVEEYDADYFLTQGPKLAFSSDE